jgi:4-amino-4-deoxy-L-arabinose transferase-like glycosyltransferase
VATPPGQHLLADPVARLGAHWRSAVAERPALALAPMLVFLVLVAYAFPDRQDDEAGYLELARNLTHGHYVSGRPDALLDADPSYPDLWFGPGLPLVLVLPVALGLPLGLTRLVGPLALFAALLVFFHLVGRYTSRRAALVATWALALYLPFYSVLPNLHSEPPAVLFAVVGLYATARLLDEPGRGWVALGGAALAGLAITRVDYGWVLTFLLAAAAVWWLRSRTAPARRLAAMCALGLLLCVPWLAYTSAKTGRALQWGNSGSLSLYWMSSPYDGDLGDWQQANVVFTDPNLAPHRPFFASLRGHALPQQNARLERRALSNIARHPAKYAKNVLANVSRMFFDAPYSYSPQRLGALFFAVPNALLLGLLLVAGGLAVYARAALPRAALPFALFAAASLVLHALLAAYPRMLLPIVPAIAWLAAVTIANHVRADRRTAQDGA